VLGVESRQVPASEVAMDPGLEAALYYDDDLLVTEEVRYEQDGPHSPLVGRDLGPNFLSSSPVD
jgi:hypothetical protein